MRTVVVTEGTQGIGAATCRAFQQKGYRVVAMHTEDNPTASLFSQQTHIPLYAWNPQELENYTSHIAAIEALYGPIDIFVHTLLAPSPRPLLSIDGQQWQARLTETLTGFFYLAKSLLPSMCQRGNGRLLHIQPPCQAPTALDKLSMAGLIKTLALEAAIHGTTVNMITPGWIRIDLLEALPADLLETAMRVIPLKRLGIPEEVAALAVFLASPAAAFITGTNFHINGGQWIQD